MSVTDPTALTVRFRGVRGSIPVPAPEMSRYGGNTSCVEVRCGDELLILDAGTGIRSLGQDLLNEFGTRAIEANLLISHTHWDHIQGLPFFAPAFLAHHQIRILGCKGSGTRLARALRNQMDPIYFPVSMNCMTGLAGVSEIDSDQTRLGHFSICVTSLNHPGGCAGFRIGAHGSTMAYLPDHEPYRAGGDTEGDGNARRAALVDFLRDVDLLILDTQYTEEEYPGRFGWGHGCLPDSVALAIDAGVRQLKLFHHDPTHNDDQIDEMVNEARRIAGTTRLRIGAATESDTVVLQRSAISGPIVTENSWLPAAALTATAAP